MISRENAERAAEELIGLQVLSARPQVIWSGWYRLPRIIVVGHAVESAKIQRSIILSAKRNVRRTWIMRIPTIILFSYGLFVMFISGFGSRFIWRLPVLHLLLLAIGTLLIIILRRALLLIEIRRIVNRLTCTQGAPRSAIRAYVTPSND